MFIYDHIAYGRLHVRQRPFARGTFSFAFSCMYLESSSLERTVCSLALSRLNNLLFCFVICITRKAAQCSGKDYTEPASDLIILEKWNILD